MSIIMFNFSGGRKCNTIRYELIRMSYELSMRTSLRQRINMKIIGKIVETCNALVGL